MRRIAFMSITLLIVALLFTLDGYGGYRALYALVGHGGSYWTTLDPKDPANPAWIARALQDGPAPLVLGALEWTAPAPGVERAEAPVLLDGTQVDTLVLSRFAPEQTRFEIHLDQLGAHSVGKWMEELNAQFVINGSYFDHHGLPSTPLIAGGQQFGPREYDAVHGALLLDRGATGLVDLGNRKWQSVLLGQQNALVSYPLLLSPERTVRVRSDSRWLASRSFAGTDDRQRLVFGTTLGGFFSLARLGDFLPTTPLGLTAALNLDGGPIACQALRVGPVAREQCGGWETQTSGETIKLLRPGVESAHWGLPVVIAGFVNMPGAQAAG